jgi:outer membrane protein assembly factor BamB
VAALREKLGRTVVVQGPVRRFYNKPENKDDPGLVLLDVKSVRDHAGPPLTSQEAGMAERTVTGKVVEAPAGVPRVEHGSNLRIAIDSFFPDAESSPVGVLDGTEPRVIMGFGIDGQAVVCLDARTGLPVWKTKTPYPAFGAAAIEGGRVLLGMGNGSFTERDPHPVGLLLCLSLKDGKELWQTKVGDILFGAVALSEGQAFLASRDGQVYVVDLGDGHLVRTLGVGAAMVGSPAVTHSSVYVGTEAGKIFCLDRKEGRVRWSEALTPGKLILSSPTVSSGRLLVGTDSRGLVCLADKAEGDRPLGPPRPWQGPGGNASRSGAADEGGLPQIDGDKAEARPVPEALRTGPVGPVAAAGDRAYAVRPDSRGGALLYTLGVARGDLAGTVGLPGPVQDLVADENGPFLVVLDHGKPQFLAPGRPGLPWSADTFRGQLALGRDRLLGTLPGGNLGCIDLGRRELLWRTDLGGAPGSPPAYVHNLILVALPGPPPRLFCLNDVNGGILWSKTLESSPVQPVTVLGDRVFLVESGKPPETSVLECRSLIDGAGIWRKALGKDEGIAISPVVASGDFAVVATSDEKVLPFSIVDGTLREPIPVGGAAVMPALLGELLVVVGESRIGVHDLSSHQFPWKYGSEDDIGTATGAPAIAGGVLFVGTTKQGLVSIGPRGSPAPQ